MFRSRSLLVAACAAGLLLAGSANAADADFTIVIKEHRFEPAELPVPAGKKFRLLVRNLDATAEEFESHDLRREKMIPGKSEAIVTIGPLKPGSYAFFGDFNQKTARGSIIAK